jgi:hypothetical protein
VPRRPSKTGVDPSANRPMPWDAERAVSVGRTLAVCTGRPYPALAPTPTETRSGSTTVPESEREARSQSGEGGCHEIAIGATTAGRRARRVLGCHGRRCDRGACGRHRRIGRISTPSPAFVRLHASRLPLTRPCFARGNRASVADGPLPPHKQWGHRRGRSRAGWRCRNRTEGVTTTALARRTRADANAALGNVDDVRVATRQSAHPVLASPRRLLASTPLDPTPATRADSVSRGSADLGHRVTASAQTHPRRRHLAPGASRPYRTTAAP